MVGGGTCRECVGSASVRAWVACRCLTRIRRGWWWGGGGLDLEGVGGVWLRRVLGIRLKGCQDGWGALQYWSWISTRLVAHDST